MKIAQVIQSDSWGELTPAVFERGVGGREGAMLRLSKEWAALGHEVTNFVGVKKASRFHESMFPTRAIAGFHEYIPLSLAQPMLSSFPYDAVIAWECPSIFASDHIMEKQKVRLVHMQVAHLGEEEEAAEKYATGVVALSEWAKEFLVHSGLNHPNLYVRPNGVDIGMYPRTPRFRNATKAREDFSLVYSSSPDRGLHHFKKLWPMIREDYPKGKLIVAYGAKQYAEEMKWSHARIAEVCLDILELLEMPGVVDVGKVGQKTLAKLQQNASAWIYPADTIQATETGCISAIENMAAGNPCIMTDADCLKDEFSDVAAICPLPINPDEIMRVLESSMFHIIYNEIVEEGRAFAESRHWGVIAPTWLDLFEENRSHS